MVVNPDKVRENRAQRQAGRLGFILKKSRARNWKSHGQGSYMLVDIDTGGVIQGPNLNCSLSQIESYLSKYETGLKRQMEEKNN
jgi:hypothetical protein